MSQYLSPMQLALALCVFLILTGLAVTIRELLKPTSTVVRWKSWPYTVLFYLPSIALAALAAASSPNWPAPLVVIAFTLAGAASGFLLHVPFDWLATELKTRGHTDMAGHFIGLVGVLYAIVLGFVVVTAWDQFNHADELLTNEQLDAYDLFNTLTFYHYGNGQNAPVHKILQSLDMYADGMQAEARQMTRRVRLYFPGSQPSEPNPSNCDPISPNPQPSEFPSLTNDDTIATLRCNILKLPTNGLHDQAIYASSLRLLNDLSDVRNNRRHNYISPPLRPEMWTAFVLGGLILVGMLYLVEASSRGQKVRATAVGSMVGMMWALALIFNHPFNGSARLHFDRWRYIEQGFTVEESHLPTTVAPTPRSSSSH